MSFSHSGRLDSPPLARCMQRFTLLAVFVALVRFVVIFAGAR